jgi:hypothetical protein
LARYLRDHASQCDALAQELDALAKRERRRPGRPAMEQNRIFRSDAP